MTDDDIKKEVEKFAKTHDSMLLPYEWLKYVPCRYEIYSTYRTVDGIKYTNILLYKEV